MKKLLFLLPLMLPILCYSQFVEDFSDGNFTHQPTWIGMTDKFVVNDENQLQSNATEQGKIALSTRSNVFDDAVWEFWVKIGYNPSGSNYASVYLISDRVDVTKECFGYYVQIGNTKDEISLYRQEGSRKTKIIDGKDKVTNLSAVAVKVRVTRSRDGAFALYRKLEKDDDFVKEGDVVDNKIVGSKYFSILVSNTKTTGKKFFFDDIKVEGKGVADKIPPVWTKLSIEEPNSLLLEFSEEIDFSSATFGVDQGIGSPRKMLPSEDKMSIRLSFEKNFEKHKVYTVTANNIKDLSANLLQNSQKQIGLTDLLAVGDIIINEILPDPHTGKPEYFEIYNTSDKVLELSTVSYGVRKSDGTYTPTAMLPRGTYIFPKKYLAVTPDATTLRQTYSPPSDAHIITVEKWTSLNNHSATLVLAAKTDSTLYDQVTYDTDWHHAMINNPKGVALERINATLPSNDESSWHSAASDVHYGTPGYKNSQQTDIVEDKSIEKIVWTTPSYFSPNNDGIDDICFIHYKTPTQGYTANISIFTPAGQKLTTLADNQLIGKEGFITWDGNTDRGQNVNAGIYVLYFEIINVNTGDKKIEKIPIVVSIR